MAIFRQLNASTVPHKRGTKTKVPTLITLLKQSLENLETFQNGKYTNGLKICIMQVFSMSATINNVDSAIRALTY